MTAQQYCFICKLLLYIAVMIEVRSHPDMSGWERDKIFTF
jgi:hypothetical protein